MEVKSIVPRVKLGCSGVKPSPEVKSGYKDVFAKGLVSLAFVSSAKSFRSVMAVPAPKTAEHVRAKKMRWTDAVGTKPTEVRP